MWWLVPYALLLLGTDACMRSKATVRLTCPKSQYMTAQSRAESAMITWDRHNFSINSDRPIKAIYQTVPLYGTSVSVHRAFYEGSHFIEYKAVDDAGNFDSCSFTVTLTVLRCAPLRNPTFGAITCDADNLYGSICVMSCVPGYSIVGAKTIECQREGHWSDDTPFCRTTTCPDPGTPLHGTRLCTTATHAYGSICRFACNSGYQLIGNERLICRADQQGNYWSTQTPFCKEITPPRLKQCPSNIQVTTSTAVTELEKPPVVFATDDGQRTAHTCTHFGQRDLHNFTIGTHLIRCQAFNPDFGEQAVSTCSFTIRVKSNPCRPLAQPLNGFLLCSLAQGGGTSLTETTCKLFCNKGYALPRDDGPNSSIFECDHTGTWQPNDHVPSCVRPKRPQELKLPSEIYYKSTNCTDKKQLNDVRVTFQSAVQATIRMQHACAMNPGDCIIEDVVTSCSLSEDGRTRRRRRRRNNAGDGRANNRRTLRNGRGGRRHRRRGAQPDPVYHLPIRFHFATRVPEDVGEWPDQYHLASNRLFGMFDYFERYLLEGTFSIRSRVTHLQIEEDKQSLTYAPIKAICDIGYTFNPKILFCVPCGAGTYFDVRQNRCVICGVGSYQNEEAQFRCKPCPRGTASVEPGSVNVTQCLDIDDCASNPCLNNGRCVDSLASYLCQCRPGFTGTHCEQRVYDCSRHSCLHGGTCIPTSEETYICNCRPSYSGTFCQYIEVHGGWSDWSEWSRCSQTCDGGATWRNRTCTSPSPSNGGHSCEGAAVEMKVCNEQTCPVCKRLRRPYRGSLECVEEAEEGDEMHLCTISCDEGYDFSSPIFDVYTCGRNTSYLWPHESPDNPRCILPACTKCTSQEELGEIRQKVKARAYEETTGIACLQDGTCSLEDPQVDGCDLDTDDSSRRIRRNTHNQSVNIRMSLVYHGEISHGTQLAPTFQRTSEELRLVGESLLNRTRGRALILEVAGHRVTANPDLTHISRKLACGPGSVEAPDATHCVECGPGSYYSLGDSGCILCEEGTYQPAPAQDKCLPCPMDYTTYGRGARLRIECYAIGGAPPEISDEQYEGYRGYQEIEPSVPLMVILSAIVAALCLAVAGGLLVFYRRTSKNPSVKTSDDQANEVPAVIQSG